MRDTKNKLGQNISYPVKNFDLCTTSGVDNRTVNSKIAKEKIKTYFITTENGVNSVNSKKNFTLRYRYEEQKVLKFSNFQRTKNFHLMGLW